jgi:hypothetical protein
MRDRGHHEPEPRPNKKASTKRSRSRNGFGLYGRQASSLLPGFLGFYRDFVDVVDVLGRP